MGFQQVLLDEPIPPREGFQRLDIVGIGKEPGIQDHIGVRGVAPLVTEAEEPHRRVAGGQLGYQGRNAKAEFRQAQVAGIEDSGGQGPDGCEQFPFTADTLARGAEEGQMMWAPGLREPAQQHLLLRFDEDHLHGNATQLETRQERSEFLRKVRLTAVHAHHQTLSPGLQFRLQFQQGFEKPGGDVVEGGAAAVFQRPQHRVAASARESSDDDEFHNLKSYQLSAVSCQQKTRGPVDSW